MENLVMIMSGYFGWSLFVISEDAAAAEKAAIRFSVCSVLF